MRITRTIAILLIAVSLVLGACAMPETTPPAAPETTPTPVSYTLITSVNPPGGGSVSPSSGQYKQGGQIDVTATSSTGYTFDSWSGDASGKSPTMTITMDSDKTVTAHFSKTAAPATDIVHITRTGKKYHRAGCRYLSQSDIPIERAEAIERGYTPCSVCRP